MVVVKPGMLKPLESHCTCNALSTSRAVGRAGLLNTCERGGADRCGQATASAERDTAAT